MYTTLNVQTHTRTYRRTDAHTYIHTNSHLHAHTRHSAHSTTLRFTLLSSSLFYPTSLYSSLPYVMSQHCRTVLYTLSPQCTSHQRQRQRQRAICTTLFHTTYRLSLFHCVCRSTTSCPSRYWRPIAECSTGASPVTSQQRTTSGSQRHSALKAD